MNISQWKIGDRTFFSLEVYNRLLLMFAQRLETIFYKDKALVGGGGILESNISYTCLSVLPRPDLFILGLGSSAI